jgi:hypothetical protein
MNRADLSSYPIALHDGVRRMVRVAVICALACAGSLRAAPADALPLHSHCDEQFWFSDVNAGIIPAAPVVNPINVILTATVTQPAPGTAVRDCRYELSDIQTLFITLSILDPAGGAGGVISFAGLGVNGRAPVMQGPFTFTDGMGMAFDFPSHTSGGLDIHLIFPNPTITVTLLGGQSELGTRLIGANLDPQGFHYFIPEPGTLTLLALGLGGLVAGARKRHTSSVR